MNGEPRAGGVLFREQVVSRGLGGSRDVWVWLPPAARCEGARRFPLLVSVDGVRAFRGDNGEGLDLDAAVISLAEEGAMPEAIIASVCPGSGDEESRADDLSPERRGVEFADFLRGELLEHLDRRYSTLASPASRILCGTGLGGLTVIATMLKAEVAYGKFVTWSASFEDVSCAPPAHCGMLREIAQRSTLPADVRLFSDYGTEGLDECYELYYRELGCLFRERGWRDGVEFRIERVPGGAHAFSSWRQRIAPGLRFVTGVRPSGYDR